MIPAAGQGLRLGGAAPKALVRVGNTPLLGLTLRRFAEFGLIDGAVIVVPGGHEAVFGEVLSASFPACAFCLVAGGAQRQESVRKGLDRLAPDTDIVVIHDAARPFVSPVSIRASIDAAAACGAATVAIPAVDTILEADHDAYLLSTPDRKRLWACQTPQTFQVDVIRGAHAWAREEGLVMTDDASLVRCAGQRVKLVEGTPLNFKITTQTDLALARRIVEESLV